ncbi:hypothetical protein BH747_12515 [Enterococcus villorum]|uniref:Uncharacterized protein n=1 Tax=Enterococcus villorum TaxID=112904 RepID=A0A1V8Y6E4_9ENTE|nr:hypothetical protein [Enterococcus villorum]OQO68184.1 hypothetical protein BH747_12515 [Enterococcus villorum]OQO73758.1 hypothetical protein BH744_08665 [Enterococcus villorum]
MFYSFIFTAGRSKDHSLENIDKVDVAVNNGSILNFKRAASTVTESNEILKITQLVSSLNLKKSQKNIVVSQVLKVTISGCILKKTYL